ncbi:hypothetical protein E4U55_001248 [Claviceps digitariae]|nr:hypothetical protein E4U55_001248 [Claviceps digitariae]
MRLARWDLRLSPLSDAGWDEKLVFVERPSFPYAGNVGFVSHMAEMELGQSFIPTLTFLRMFSMVLYVFTAVAVCCLSGQYTASFALGSAATVPAQVAYAVVLMAIKYLYVVVIRA